MIPTYLPSDPWRLKRWAYHDRDDLILFAETVFRIPISSQDWFSSWKCLKTFIFLSAEILTSITEKSCKKKLITHSRCRLEVSTTTTRRWCSWTSLSTRTRPRSGPCWTTPWRSRSSRSRNRTTSPSPATTPWRVLSWPWGGRCRTTSSPATYPLGCLS